MDWKKVLSLITSHIDDGIFIVDRTGTVIYYNESAGNQAGVSFQNAIGRHILALFPRLDHETSTLLRVMESGIPIVGDIQSYYNHRQKRVTIITNTYPLLEGDCIVGALEISKDIITYRDINEKIASMDRHAGGQVMEEKATFTLDDIICESPAMVKMKSTIQKIASSDASVLVSGETGTGKEMVVQSIHNLSSRREMPFIVQNSAAIPVTLLESLLFGTSMGSFTGSKDSIGLFELADGGTLFLDEINSMDLQLQAKLLRVIQDGTIRRIGDQYTRKVDVRVIVAMNIKPSQALAEGKIRRDLFYRLNVLSLEVPCLRERVSDIPLLRDYFIREFNQTLNKKVKGLNKEVEQLFNAYHWPGNVRELRHTIEHAMLFGESDLIGLDDLPDSLRNQSAFEGKKEKISTELRKDTSLKEIIDAYEKEVIETVLRNNNYVLKASARQLKIPRQTLYNKMRSLDIVKDI